MGGGLRKRFFALAALGTTSLPFGGVSPLAAADLGGSCCADLEERIAELEATTARKGNRKVSLEIYGHVNQGVLYWDDGVESNAYVVTNDNARTRFGFRGKAKISDDWEAGYTIEIGIRTANSKRFTQNNATGNDFSEDVGLDLRDAYWYLKSKSIGAASVGNQASAMDAITETNLTQTRDFAKYSDVEDTGLGLLLRSGVDGDLTAPKIGATGVSGLTWRRLIGDGGDQPGEGERRFNLVKYASPTFAGFSASASWGEDDFWDIALRYSGEFSGFKLAAGIGYGEITDNNQTKTVCPSGQATGLGSDTSCTQFGGSVSVLHEPTGLFLNVAAGEKTDDLIKETTRFANSTGVDDSQHFWAVQSGIEKKFNEFGKTTIYGEYYDYEGGANGRRTVDANDALDVFGGSASTIWKSGVEVWGAGIAQGFDKAALVLYLSYRHVEGDLVLRELVGGQAAGDIANSPIGDVDLVFAGGIIKF